MVVLGVLTSLQSSEYIGFDLEASNFNFLQLTLISPVPKLTESPKSHAPVGDEEY